MTRRIVLCHVFTITIGLVISWFLLMLLDRRPPVTLYPDSAFILPNPAKAGDTIAITWKAKFERDCAGEVIPRVIDSAGRIYEYAKIPTVYHRLMTSNPGEFTKPLTLPHMMPTGPARYEAVIFRWCNFVQQSLWPILDKQFPIQFVVD